MSDLIAIPEGITAEDFRRAFKDFDGGERPPGYKAARNVFIAYQKKLYPIKIIVGLAARRLNGGKPLADRFKSGDTSECNRLVLRLGFDIVKKKDQKESDRLDQEFGPHTKELRRIEAEIETEELSKPLSPAVEQERTLRMIGLRRGRDKFRKKLVRKYGGRCPITGCNALPALEAAHIRPYSTSQSNQPDNGLLLRADIHTLFDLDLIGIEPTNFKVAVAPQLKGTEYEEFEGKRISYKLDLEAVQERWDDFCGN